LLIIDFFLRRGVIPFVVMFIVSGMIISAFYIFSLPQYRATFGVGGIGVLVGCLIYFLMFPTTISNSIGIFAGKIDKRNSMTSERKLSVFLCYASQDKTKVHDLYTRLHSEGWVDLWLDEEKLEPGQDWRLEIDKAIDQADVVLVCLSDNSITKEGYVQKEIRKALDKAGEKPDRAIFIIPVKVEECSVPDRLSRWQWVDLAEPSGYEKLNRALDARSKTLGLVNK